MHGSALGGSGICWQSAIALAEAMWVCFAVSKIQMVSVLPSSWLCLLAAACDLACVPLHWLMHIEL